MRRATAVLSGLLGLLVPLTVSGAMAVAAPAQAAEQSCDGRPATIVVTANPGTYRTNPVVGTPGDDVIVGTDLADTIDGAGGNNTICGLAGDDHLVGGAGNDHLFSSSTVTTSTTTNPMWGTYSCLRREAGR